MKLFGLFLLIVAAGSIGWSRATALRRRAAALAASRRFVIWITEQMRYTAAPIAELMRSAAQSEEFSAFSLPKTVEKTLHDQPFPIAWKRAVTISEREHSFTKEEGDLLRRFGEGLGRTDCEGQVAHGELFASLILEKQKRAEQLARERGRIETIVWPAGAMVLALLLL